MYIELNTPNSTRDWDDYFHLRWRVLRAPWRQTIGSEKDDLESDSYHLLARINDEAVGVGRLHLNTPSEAQIRFMAVAPNYRGKGVGRSILVRLEQEAITMHATQIILNARQTCIGFYQVNGYQSFRAGDTLFGTIEHVVMQKILTTAD